jgi:secondary thiamine-phosphate synthase enzyme
MRMKIYNEYLTIEIKQRREFRNVTPSVRAAVQKGGIHEGIILVSALHANAAIFLSDEEEGLLRDIEAWLDRLAPIRDDYQHAKGIQVESNAGVHLQSLLLNSQVVVGLSEGRLDLGPWQHVIYADLDGNRPKRILIKVMGE